MTVRRIRGVLVSGVRLIGLRSLTEISFVPTQGRRRGGLVGRRSGRRVVRRRGRRVVRRRGTLGRGVRPGQTECEWVVRRSFTLPRPESHTWG